VEEIGEKYIVAGKKMLGDVQVGNLYLK